MIKYFKYTARLRDEYAIQSLTVDSFSEWTNKPSPLPQKEDIKNWQSEAPPEVRTKRKGNTSSGRLCYLCNTQLKTIKQAWITLQDLFCQFLSQETLEKCWLACISARKQKAMKLCGVRLRSLWKPQNQRNDQVILQNLLQFYRNIAVISVEILSGLAFPQGVQALERTKLCKHLNAPTRFDIEGEWNNKAWFFDVFQNT